LLGLQGCGGSSTDTAEDDVEECVDCVDCSGFTVKITDPDPKTNGTLRTVTCDLGKTTDPDGNMVFQPEEGTHVEAELTDEEGRLCFGPNTPRCLCNYYKWQVLNQHNALPEDYLRHEVDEEKTPIVYATECEYNNMKHQCHEQFGMVQDPSKSTERKVGVSACTCEGECPCACTGECPGTCT
jgi:hypothetical protein